MADADGSGTPGAPARRRHWLRWLGLALAVLLVAGTGLGWWVYRKLDGNITADTTAASELEQYEKERPALTVRGAQNILLIGSDSRAGRDNGQYGRDGGTQRSDTTILLHLAADRKSATAVSVPRDLMVEMPSCGTADGGRTPARFAQFNWAFQFGGAACTIRTVEKMTGIRIDHHVVVDFGGFKRVVDAVGGVEVCLRAPVDDAEARVRLPAGRQTLDGEQALGFVRARHSLGNGSDTERMDRQQQFLASLVKKVQSNGVLLNPARLYPVLDAATSALTTDPDLASLRGLYELVRSMRDIPVGRVQFLTAPRQPYTANPNRDQLLEPDAGNLFRRLRMDRPVAVVQARPEPGRPAAEPAGTASPAPTFTGTTADAATCR
ncbi:LCP family protein [Streptomyces bambusae]|uniref:LCP family protein n=1 Tax=Streptomyces bambusae TaxID=1550616 RepID=UPI001CFCAA5F|nr:LCP family protein [Streptomyces bambusae]MCB5166322.1 LCP family protein [Streptomyces bambusae]